MFGTTIPVGLSSVPARSIPHVSGLCDGRARRPALRTSLALSRRVGAEARDAEARPPTEVLRQQFLALPPSSHTGLSNSFHVVSLRVCVGSYRGNQSWMTFSVLVRE